MWPYGKSVPAFLKEEWGYLFEWQQVAIEAVGILLGIVLVAFLVRFVVQAWRQRDG